MTLVKSRVVSSRAAGPDVADLSGPFLLGLLSGDVGAVETIAACARARGADTALLVRDLLSPALAEVGRMWSRGEASVAEEHLATALGRRVLSRSCGLAAAEPGTARIVFACLEGEFHDVGIRFLADVARECGWDAESLGANVPRESLVRFIAQRPPAALALSLTLAGHVPEAARTIAQVREVAPATIVLVGGRVFFEDPERVCLTGADAAIGDAVALRDWLRSHGKRACVAAPVGATTRGLPEATPSALLERCAGRH